MFTTFARAAAFTLLATTAFAESTTSHSGHGDTATMAHGEAAVLAKTDSGLVISDGFARAATPSAKSGAAFLMIQNTGDSDDRLIAAATTAAKRVELHTHEAAGEGVVRMVHVPEGFDIPAGGMVMLERGGRHVMMMGLTAPLAQGATVDLTLTFEQAGEVNISVPVDLKRGAGHGHGAHTNSGS